MTTPPRRSSRLLSKPKPSFSSRPTPTKSHRPSPFRRNTTTSPSNPRSSHSQQRNQGPSPLSRSKRRAGPRPRWTFGPAPPEAYLIIRAHRRPVGGWGEVWNWMRKRDEWSFTLSSVSDLSGLDLVQQGPIWIRLVVEDQDGSIPPDNHILSTRLCKLILQYRYEITNSTSSFTAIHVPTTSSSTPTRGLRMYTGIQIAQSFTADGQRIHGFSLPIVPDLERVEARLFDLGSICTGGRGTCLASWSMDTTDHQGNESS